MILNTDEFEARVMDREFRDIAVVNDFSSFIWNDVYCGAGDFELELPFNTKYEEIFQQDYYIACNLSDKIMIIEKIQITESEEGAVMIVSGSSLEKLLERRIVAYRTSINDQTFLSGSGSSHFLKSINKVFNDCFGVTPYQKTMNPSKKNQMLGYYNTDRTVSNFKFDMKGSLENDPNDHIIKAVANISSVGDNLYDLINNLCSEKYFGFRVLYDYVDKLLYLSIYDGRRLDTMNSKDGYIILSMDDDNITSTDYSYDYSVNKTAMYVTGDETDYDDTYAVFIKNSSEATGLDRREITVQSKTKYEKYYKNGSTEQIYEDEPEDEDLSLKHYYNNLLAYGHQELRKNYTNKGKTLNAEISQHIQYEYGKDYYLGDVVKVVDSFGNRNSMRITEYTISCDANGIVAYPTFEEFNPEWVANNAVETITSNEDFYQTIAIYFKVEGEQNAHYTIYREANEMIDAHPTIPTKDGYTFYSWNTQSAGVNEPVYSSSSSYVNGKTESVTYTAIFMPNKIIATFDLGENASYRGPNDQKRNVITISNIDLDTALTEYHANSTYEAQEYSSSIDVVYNDSILGTGQLYIRGNIINLNENYLIDPINEMDKKFYPLTENTTYHLNTISIYDYFDKFDIDDNSKEHSRVIGAYGDIEILDTDNLLLDSYKNVIKTYTSKSEFIYKYKEYYRNGYESYLPSYKTWRLFIFNIANNLNATDVAYYIDNGEYVRSTYGIINEKGKTAYRPTIADGFKLYYVDNAGSFVEFQGSTLSKSKQYYICSSQEIPEFKKSACKLDLSNKLHSELFSSMFDSGTITYDKITNEKTLRSDGRYYKRRITKTQNANRTSYLDSYTLERSPNEDDLIDHKYYRQYSPELDYYILNTDSNGYTKADKYDRNSTYYALQDQLGIPIKYISTNSVSFNALRRCSIQLYGFSIQGSGTKYHKISLGDDFILQLKYTAGIKWASVNANSGKFEAIGENEGSNDMLSALIGFSIIRRYDGACVYKDFFEYNVEAHQQDSDVWNLFISSIYYDIIEGKFGIYADIIYNGHTLKNKQPKNIIDEWYGWKTFKISRWFDPEYKALSDNKYKNLSDWYTYVIYGNKTIKKCNINGKTGSTIYYSDNYLYGGNFRASENENIRFTEDPAEYLIIKSAENLAFQPSKKSKETLGYSDYTESYLGSDGFYWRVNDSVANHSFLTIRKSSDIRVDNFVTSYATNYKAVNSTNNIPNFMSYSITRNGYTAIEFSTKTKTEMYNCKVFVNGIDCSNNYVSLMTNDKVYVNIPTSDKMSDDILVWCVSSPFKENQQITYNWLYSDGWTDDECKLILNVDEIGDVNSVNDTDLYIDVNGYRLTASSTGSMPSFNPKDAYKYGLKNSDGESLTKKKKVDGEEYIYSTYLALNSPGLSISLDDDKSGKNVNELYSILPSSKYETEIYDVNTEECLSLKDFVKKYNILKLRIDDMKYDRYNSSSYSVKFNNSEKRGIIKDYDKDISLYFYNSRTFGSFDSYNNAGTNEINGMEYDNLANVSYGRVDDLQYYFSNPEYYGTSNKFNIRDVKYGFFEYLRTLSKSSNIPEIYGALGKKYSLDKRNIMSSLKSYRDSIENYISNSINVKKKGEDIKANAAQLYFENVDIQKGQDDFNDFSELYLKNSEIDSQTVRDYCYYNGVLVVIDYSEDMYDIVCIDGFYYIDSLSFIYDIHERKWTIGTFIGGSFNKLATLGEKLYFKDQKTGYIVIIPNESFLNNHVRTEIIKKIYNEIPDDMFLYSNSKQNTDLITWNEDYTTWDIKPELKDRYSKITHEATTIDGVYYPETNYFNTMVVGKMISNIYCKYSIKPNEQSDIVDTLNGNMNLNYSSPMANLSVRLNDFNYIDETYTGNITKKYGTSRSLNGKRTMYPTYYRINVGNDDVTLKSFYREYCDYFDLRQDVLSNMAGARAVESRCPIKDDTIIEYYPCELLFKNNIFRDRYLNGDSSNDLPENRYLIVDFRDGYYKLLDIQVIKSYGYAKNRFESYYGIEGFAFWSINNPQDIQNEETLVYFDENEIDKKFKEFDFENELITTDLTLYAITKPPTTVLIDISSKLYGKYFGRNFISDPDDNAMLRYFKEFLIDSVEKIDSIYDFKFYSDSLDKTVIQTYPVDHYLDKEHLYEKMLAKKDFKIYSIYDKLIWRVWLIDEALDFDENGIGHAYDVRKITANMYGEENIKDPFRDSYYNISKNPGDHTTFVGWSIVNTRIDGTEHYYQLHNAKFVNCDESIHTNFILDGKGHNYNNVYSDIMYDVKEKDYKEYSFLYDYKVTEDEILDYKKTYYYLPYDSTNYKVYDSINNDFNPTITYYDRFTKPIELYAIYVRDVFTILLYDEEGNPLPFDESKPINTDEYWLKSNIYYIVTYLVNDVVSYDSINDKIKEIYHNKSALNKLYLCDAYGNEINENPLSSDFELRSDNVFDVYNVGNKEMSKLSKNFIDNYNTFFLKATLKGMSKYIISVYEMDQNGQRNFSRRIYLDEDEGRIIDGIELNKNYNNQHDILESFMTKYSFEGDFYFRINNVEEIGDSSNKKIDIIITYNKYKDYGFLIYDLSSINPDCNYEIRYQTSVKTDSGYADIGVSLFDPLYNAYNSGLDVAESLGVDDIYINNINKYGYLNDLVSAMTCIGEYTNPFQFASPNTYSRIMENGTQQIINGYYFNDIYVSAKTFMDIESKFNSTSIFDYVKSNTVRISIDFGYNTVYTYQYTSYQALGVSTESSYKKWIMYDTLNNIRYDDPDSFTSLNEISFMSPYIRSDGVYGGYLVPGEILYKLFREGHIDTDKLCNFHFSTYAYSVTDPNYEIDDEKVTLTYRIYKDGDKEKWWNTVTVNNVKYHILSIIIEHHKDPLIGTRIYANKQKTG